MCLVTILTDLFCLRFSTLSALCILQVFLPLLVINSLISYAVTFLIELSTRCIYGHWVKVKPLYSLCEVSFCIAACMMGYSKYLSAFNNLLYPLSMSSVSCFKIVL